MLKLAPCCSRRPSEAVLTFSSWLSCKAEGRHQDLLQSLTHQCNMSKGSERCGCLQPRHGPQHGVSLDIGCFCREKRHMLARPCALHTRKMAHRRVAVEPLKVGATPTGVRTLSTGLRKRGRRWRPGGMQRAIGAVQASPQAQAAHI